MNFITIGNKKIDLSKIKNKALREALLKKASSECEEGQFCFRWGNGHWPNGYWPNGWYRPPYPPAWPNWNNWGNWANWANGYWP